MSIELREPVLVGEIEQRASQMAQSAEEVLEAAVRAYLASADRQAIHAETEAFWAQHDDLVATYSGQHVALYRGQVVDHDTEVARLEERIRTRFGSWPVLISPVEPGPRRDLRWRGGRMEAKARAL